MHFRRRGVQANAGADRHQAIMNEYERLQRENPRDDHVKGEIRN